MSWLWFALACSPTIDGPAELATALDKAHGPLTVSREGDVLHAEDADGFAVSLPLADLRQTCASDAGACRAHIAELVDAVAFVPPQPVPQRLRPMLTGARWLAAYDELRATTPGLAPLPTQEIAPGLVQFLVLDYPSTVLPVDAQALDSLSLSSQAAHTQALAQLAREVRLEGHERDTNGHGVFPSVDAYTAVRIRFDDQWAPIAAQVSGPLWVAAPGRDQLLFVGGSEPGAATFHDRVAALHDAARHPVSPQVYAWSPSGLRPVPPRESPE